MNIFLLIALTAIIFQNQVFASEEPTNLSSIESTKNASIGAYSEFEKVILLVDDPERVDRNRAFLYVHSNGRLAVYPILDGLHRCVTLSHHSLTDILSHWTPAKVKDDIYSFSFVCWGSKGWEPVRVDLQFCDNICRRFKVVSGDIKMQDWLETAAIPDEVYRRQKGGKLKLPLAIGLVEGPCCERLRYASSFC
jgi:hypothetical protein